MKDLVITKQKNRTVALVVSDQITEELDFYDEKQLEIGSIYVGRIESICRNINAFFVRVSEKNKVFVPFGKKTVFLFADERSHEALPKVNDEILVMIKKHSQGQKETEATPVLSLDGFLVTVSCEEKGILISSRVEKEEAAALKELILELQEYLEHDYKVIIRSNYAAFPDRQLVVSELAALVKRLDQIKKQAVHQSLYSKCFDAGPAYHRRLRELYYLNYDRVITDEPAIYEDVIAFFRDYYPEKQSIVTLYQDKVVSLNVLMKIETRITEALSGKVWLPCGGYLLIEQTQAMVVIDVNSGKTTNRKDKEDCFLQINTEAAEEIMHQLRLKNLSGIIVVDFLKMKKPESWQIIEKVIQLEAKRDSARTKFIERTSLGLVEITREKTSLSLQEQI